MKSKPAMRRRWSATIALLFLSSCAMAQGTFVNFETPQVKPLAIATLTSGSTTKEFLLACNTPDNSVEIYDAVPSFAFIRRVPVGLGPVTVKWNSALKRFYTCNFDGDSVSIVGLKFTGTPPVLTATLERTERVGDEPADLTFVGSGSALRARVTLSTRSSYIDCNPFNLTPDPVGEVLIKAGLGSGGTEIAMKMPRRIEHLSDARTFALNFMGENEDPTALELADFDLWIDDPLNLAVKGIKGLGSTNYGFTINSAKTRMFVVGALAKNTDGVGVLAVKLLGTGFVQSHLWVVDIPVGATPTVVPEAVGGVPPTLNYHSINLNRDYTVTYSGTPPIPTVAQSLALSQPSDVVIVNEGVAGSSTNPTRLAVSMFQSDVVAFLTASTTTPGGWNINRVTIPLLNPAGGYSIGGPRGLALSKLGNGGSGYLFVSNRLDNSIVAIDPVTQTITTQFALANDPTPTVIRTGRKFLYHAGQTSGSRTVACGSCHVDGRTDGLAWDLGDPSLGPLLPPRLINFPGVTATNFESEKGPLVTQTLQGLVDWPVEDNAQIFMTNAPYHWRGDKGDFVEFNEAFVNLQNMTDISPTTDPRGLTIPEMEAYRAFINTIMHPPNPEQKLDRTMSGTMEVNSPDDASLATGQLRGMILFHTNPHMTEAEMGRACVDCHSLPDGSFNTLTDLIPVARTITAPTTAQNHLFETAALRNLRQREMVWHPIGDFGVINAVVTKQRGLAHDGEFNFALNAARSVNSFVINPAFTFPMPTLDHGAVAEFLRKFDTGVAPVVGSALKLPPSTSGTAWLTFLEGQAKEANAGLVAFEIGPSGERNYWYDVVNNVYVETTPGGSTITSLALHGLAANGTVILQSVPIGSERRIADPQGIDHPYHDLNEVPSAVSLLPMAPNTANVHIAKMSGNLNGINFPPVLGRFPLETLMDTVLGQFGVAATRHHQPPRRFRVTGDNIRYGAKLVIGLPLSSPPSLFHYIKLDLHPTKYKNPLNPAQTVFETHAEIDATMTMAFLNGGLFRSEVADAYNLVVPPTLTFNPLWNSYMIGVEDEDGQIGFAANLQTLTVQDGR